MGQPIDGGVAGSVEREVRNTEPPTDGRIT
jgi:hypothetical protein